MEFSMIITNRARKKKTKQNKDSMVVLVRNVGGGRHLFISIPTEFVVYIFAVEKKEKQKRIALSIFITFQEFSGFC